MFVEIRQGCATRLQRRMSIITSGTCNYFIKKSRTALVRPRCFVAFFKSLIVGFSDTLHVATVHNVKATHSERAAKGLRYSATQHNITYLPLTASPL